MVSGGGWAMRRSRGPRTAYERCCRRRREAATAHTRRIARTLTSHRESPEITARAGGRSNLVSAVALFGSSLGHGPLETAWCRWRASSIALHRYDAVEQHAGGERQSHRQRPVGMQRRERPLRALNSRPRRISAYEPRHALSCFRLEPRTSNSPQQRTRPFQRVPLRQESRARISVNGIIGARAARHARKAAANAQRW